MLEKISRLTKTLNNYIGKNSPVILTGVAVTGVISTVILAVKATPKALELIDQEIYSQYKEAGCEGETPTLKTKEVIKLTWKFYIPTAAVGLTTIVCIIGAHNIHLRRNAAIASLYSITESAFKEYQAKIVETIGKNKELKARDEIVTDEIKRNPIDSSQVIITGGGDTLFYDWMSGRYFKSDIEKVRKIQNKMNKDLMTEGYLSLNDLYYELGLDSIKLGEEMGWNLDHGLIDIRFSAQLTSDEKACIAIEYELVPRYAYGN